MALEPYSIPPYTVTMVSGRKAISRVRVLTTTPQVINMRVGL